jgi:CheY-like chemotaxis protein
MDLLIWNGGEKPFPSSMRLYALRNLIGSKKMKVLIADDSEQYRRLLVRILQNNFVVEIVEATNGSEALALNATRKPDLIFLDYEMPKMNGKETLEKIRNESVNKNIPVIMVTAYNDAETVQKMIDLGVSAYLVKPFSAADVLQRVNKLLPH